MVAVADADIDSEAAASTGFVVVVGSGYVARAVGGNLDSTMVLAGIRGTILSEEEALEAPGRFVSIRGRHHRTDSWQLCD